MSILSYSLSSSDEEENSPLLGSGNSASSQGSTVTATEYFPKRRVVTLTYKKKKLIAKGHFGKVFKVWTDQEGVLAMKELSDVDASNFAQELQMMELMHHPNLVCLKYSTRRHDLFMELMPTTLSTVIFGRKALKKPFPKVLACCFMYQILRGLAFMHHRQIAHRDLKPHNILVDMHFGILKICDFGSAADLSGRRSTDSYIRCRWIRAIELLCCVEDYTVAVDLWSAGVCMAAMLSQKPLFDACDENQQIIKIFTILGSPSPAESKYLHRRSKPLVPTLDSHFKNRLTNVEKQFLLMLLQYLPTKRGGAWNNLAHRYFDQLRAPECVLPRGYLPDLFNFSKEEQSYNRGLLTKINPRRFGPQTSGSPSYNSTSFGSSSSREQ